MRSISAQQSQISIAMAMLSEYKNKIKCIIDRCIAAVAVIWLHLQTALYYGPSLHDFLHARGGDLSQPLGDDDSLLLPFPNPSVQGSGGYPGKFLKTRMHVHAF